MARAKWLLVLFLVFALLLNTGAVVLANASATEAATTSGGGSAGPNDGPIDPPDYPPGSGDGDSG